MKGDYALAIDCGTQSLRAMAFDAKGTMVAKSTYVYERAYFSLQKGWAEQDPMIWWNALCSSVGKVLENKEVASGIGSISITAMRDTYVSLDKDMNIVRPSIVWLDQRRARCSDGLGKDAFAMSLVGMSATALDAKKSTLAIWIQENEPGNWERTRHYISIPCFLGYKLTGKLADSDSNICGHLPYDYRNARWYKQSDMKWRLTPIELDKLPPIVPTGSVIGFVTGEGSAATGLEEGLSVIAVGNDKACETIGSGCLDSSWASVSFGTTATIQLSIPKYVEPQTFMPCYRAVAPGLFNPEIQLYRGYWMVSWFSSQFGCNDALEASKLGISVEQYMDCMLDQVDPGCDGLLMQPYWGPVLKKPECKGSFIGCASYHTKAHFYRSIIEGINFGLMEGCDVMSSRAKIKVTHLTSNGGGSKSPQVCQITADMFGLPVHCPQTNETSGLGCAMTAFVSQGVFKDYQEASQAMVSFRSVYQPNMANHKIYSDIYHKRYLGLYKRLRSIYRDMLKETSNG